jgi:diguanylate cyclase (GGDEF)-like protein
MDPTTIIIVLAVHLVCSGVLYVLIGRGMPPRSGLGPWGSASILFGLAYLARLGAGLQNMPAWIGLVDIMLMLAVALFLSGLRQFLGRAPWRWQVFALAALGYGAAHALVFGAAGAVGRNLLQNLVLGGLYTLMTFEALRGRPHQPAGLRTPLSMLAALVGGLALLTAMRSVVVVTGGVAALYTGPLAQAYYAYASLAALLLELSLLWMVFVRLNGQLAELAVRDPLTRVLNRNGLDDVLARHFAARGAPPVTLLQVDVDHFKQINDGHGHAAGDAVLCAVAASLTSHVRGSDFVARVGGEEFLVVCAGGDAAVPLALAERLRAGVRALEVSVDEGRPSVRCTVSVGVSRRFAALAEWQRAWREADRALYAAKAAGRDRVVAFEPAPAAFSS